MKYILLFIPNINSMLKWILKLIFFQSEFSQIVSLLFELFYCHSHYHYFIMVLFLIYPLLICLFPSRISEPLVCVAIYFCIYQSIIDLFALTDLSVNLLHVKVEKIFFSQVKIHFFPSHFFSYQLNGIYLTHIQR